MREPQTLYEYEFNKDEADSTALVPAGQLPIILPGDVGWHQRQLTPANQPIPVPEGFSPPQWDAIPKKTPRDEIRPVIDERTGKFLYNSVSVGYVTRMLHRLFPSGYGEETIEAGWANPDRKPGETGEYRVALQIVAPGLFRPVMGVGSSVFHANNPQDTEAKTIAGAYTAALKNAAKKLNIGRDYDESDPEITQRQEDRVRIISTLVESLVGKGKEEEMLAVVAKHEPTAVLNGKVVAAIIEPEHMEPIQRELQRLNIGAGSKNGAK